MGVAAATGEPHDGEQDADNDDRKADTARALARGVHLFFRESRGRVVGADTRRLAPVITGGRSAVFHGRHDARVLEVAGCRMPPVLLPNDSALKLPAPACQQQRVSMNVPGNPRRGQRPLP